MDDDEEVEIKEDEEDEDEGEDEREETDSNEEDVAEATSSKQGIIIVIHMKFFKCTQHSYTYFNVSNRWRYRC